MRGKLEGPGSKIVYNEEAAGRPGTGSSHYRRSSSATRLSILVARHANVERPARCTCSCTAHRSSVTAAPHTRARPIFLRASSSLYPHLLLFSSNQSAGCFVPSVLFGPPCSRAPLPQTWFSLFFWGRQACSSSSSSSSSSTTSSAVAGANERPDPVFLSLLPPVLSRSFHHASCFFCPYPGYLLPLLHSCRSYTRRSPLPDITCP